jgi:hypothetical protein
VVAEDRSFAASEHSSHPAPVPARSAVAYGVDAAVKAVELPFPRPASDRFRVEAGRFKLAPRRYSMLARRERSHPRVWRVEF